MDTSTYMSTLDNPHVTLEMALDYLHNLKKIATIEKEVESAMKEANYTPLFTESLGQRLEQILFLTGNLPDDYHVSTLNIIVAIFKMAMPQYRLTVEANNAMERQVALKLLANHTAYVKQYFEYTHKDLNPFDKNHQEIIKAVSRALIWTGSPVGQWLYSKD